MVSNKELNVTGNCILKIHYMVDIRNKLIKIIKMVDKKSIF